MPPWLSILPPLAAILLSLLTRQVLLSLFVGVWLGTFLIFGYDPIKAFLEVIDHFITPAIADPNHVAILIFTMMLGGVAGLVTKSGGSAGLVEIVTRWATTSKRGQWVTYLLGVFIFFDDYANTLIVGNTMRPITDRLKISREKLSYLVDATSAPVAVLAISTWVGFEVGLIGDALKGTGYQADPFSVFFLSLPYRFYPIFSLILIPIVIMMGRDLGSMAVAEIRARTTGKLLRDGAVPASDLTDSREVMPRPGTPARWYNGLLPILTVILATLLGLYFTGKGAVIEAGGELGWKNILASSNSSRALMWAALSGSLVGILLSIGEKILTLSEAMEAWFGGVKSMFMACMILVLAWSIGAVTKEMKTAEFLVGVLSDHLLAAWVPTLTFVLAALMSFATGTSWGTMAILMPIIVPLAWAVNPQSAWFLNLSVSTVLAGSVFGDHCSPISDTTVMSSMTSGCDHVDHVRTQMPYALLAAFVSVICGLIPAGFGVSPWMSIGIATGFLFLYIRFFGKKVGG